MVEAGKLERAVAEREAQTFTKELLSKVKRLRAFSVRNALALSEVRRTPMPRLAVPAFDGRDQVR